MDFDAQGVTMNSNFIIGNSITQRIIAFILAPKYFLFLFQGLLFSIPFITVYV